MDTVKDNNYGSTLSYQEQRRQHDAAHIHGQKNILGRRSKYLPEFVYGGIDGIITTFAVVAGATGANLDVSVVLILGFANLFADGLSMSIGSYLSTKSEHEKYEKHAKIEAFEIKKWPAVEKEEVREIYAAKGFEGDLLDDIVEVITQDEDTWVDEMMKGEMGLIEPDSKPIMNAIMTFISFIIVGLLPLLSYIFAVFGWVSGDLFVPAIIITGLGFIGIAWLKSVINNAKLRKSIFETLSLGIVAALVAYYVGDVLESVLM